MAETAKPQKDTTRRATTAPARIESYDIARSDNTLDLAKDLAKFIRDNKLSTQVQGKEFVNVEGWQYAGSRLGIVPIVEHVLNVSTDQEIKYQAKVTLFDLRSQHTVGAGFAICSNKESGKKFYQEFAIASMAQTRAVGKAYRNILAWIIRAAGYEPTPAEEMEYTGNVPAPVAAPAPAPPTGNGAGSSAPRSEPPVMHAERSSAAPGASVGAGASAEDLRTELRSLLDALDASSPKDAKRDATRGMLDSMTAARLEEVLPTYRVLAASKYAKASQKEEIIRLLNHPMITRPEKTKMLLNINRLDEERADTAIAKLKKAIEDRENDKEHAGVAESFGQFLTDNAARIHADELTRLRGLLATHSVAQLREEWARVREELAAAPIAA